MRRFHMMWLDKLRVFRLTPAAMAREQELADGLNNQARPPLWPVAATCWLFLVSDDPKLTVADVERILTEYLRKDWLGFRAWQIRRLRTRLGAILQQYGKEN